MATFVQKDLEKNQIELMVTVPYDELVPFLEAAAKEMSEKQGIPGFRPGKAPFEVVKERVGELKLLEGALESIVRATYLNTLHEAKIESAGTPSIEIEKLAPGNELIYKVVVARMPKVIRLADEKTLKLEGRSTAVSDEELSSALKDLSKMQTRETRAQTGALISKNQKAVLHVTMKKEGVPVEGGSADRHVVYLDEDHYIPGFTDALMGLKEGDQKTFSLPFPDTHYLKHLAGALVDFEVDVKEIYDLATPDIDDEFAKSLGQDSLAGLQDRLRTNMVAEREQEEAARSEREILELIAKESRFEEIPDTLIQEEIDKMLHELRYRVEEQGGEFETYLSSIKKTIPELKLEMAAQALLRVQVALVLRAIVERDQVTITDDEIDQELDRIAADMKEKEEKAAVYAPRAREHMRTLLEHRRVLENLKKAILKPVA